MAIYGLGGTIDYIKSNDRAKKLPDKVVNALTCYLDYVEKEKGEKITPITKEEEKDGLINIF